MVFSMARVTIERTLDKVSSRFELVVLAAYRAHAIYCGSQTAVNRNDKYAVLALREIEEGKIKIDELKKIVLEKYAMESKFSTASHSFVENDISFTEMSNDENNIAENNSDNQIVKNVELNVSKDFFA